MTQQTIDISKAEDRRWTAIHAKARCEKAVAHFCTSHSIRHYLPLRRRAKRHQRRTVETFIPMFTGYLFVHIHDEEKYVLKRFSKVAHVLPIDDPAEGRLIKELQNIRQMEEISRREEVVVQPEIMPGKMVRVISGPLLGTEGIVESRGNKMKITVNVEILGQSVSAELDIGDVETEDV